MSVCVHAFVLRTELCLLTTNELDYRSADTDNMETNHTMAITCYLLCVCLSKRCVKLHVHNACSCVHYCTARCRMC